MQWRDRAGASRRNLVTHVDRQGVVRGHRVPGSETGCPEPGDRVGARVQSFVQAQSAVRQCGTEGGMTRGFYAMAIVVVTVNLWMLARAAWDL